MKNEIRQLAAIDRERNHNRQMKAIDTETKKDIHELVKSYQPIGWSTFMNDSSTQLRPTKDSIPSVKVTSQKTIYWDTGTRRNPKSMTIKCNTMEELEAQLNQIMSTYNVNFG